MADKTDQPLHESAGVLLLKSFVDRIQQNSALGEAWSHMTEGTQQHLINEFAHEIKEIMRETVTELCSAGLPTVVAAVESLAIKDEAKCVLLLQRRTAGMHALADRVGMQAIIVFADERELITGMNAIRAQVDQPELPLGDPADPPTSDTDIGGSDGGPLPDAVEEVIAGPPPAIAVDSDGPEIEGASAEPADDRSGYEAHVLMEQEAAAAEPIAEVL